MFQAKWRQAHSKRHQPPVKRFGYVQGRVRGVFVQRGVKWGWKGRLRIDWEESPGPGWEVWAPWHRWWEVIRVFLGTEWHKQSFVLERLSSLWWGGYWSEGRASCWETTVGRQHPGLRSLGHPSHSWCHRAPPSCRLFPETDQHALILDPSYKRPKQSFLLILLLQVNIPLICFSSQPNLVLPHGASIFSPPIFYFLNNCLFPPFYLKYFKYAKK